MRRNFRDGRVPSDFPKTVRAVIDAALSIGRCRYEKDWECADRLRAPDRYRSTAGVVLGSANACGGHLRSQVPAVKAELKAPPHAPTMLSHLDEKVVKSLGSWQGLVLHNAGGLEALAAQQLLRLRNLLVYL
jgi:hypothetical protein